MLPISSRYRSRQAASDIWFVFRQWLMVPNNCRFMGRQRFWRLITCRRTLDIRVVFIYEVWKLQRRTPHIYLYILITQTYILSCLAYHLLQQREQRYVPQFEWIQEKQENNKNYGYDLLMNHVIPYLEMFGSNRSPSFQIKLF